VTAAADVLSPRSRNLQGLLFSLPLIVLFLAFVVYPLYFEVTQALDRYTYEVLFNDPIYVQTIVNTLVYVGIAVNLKLFLALLLSGVLDDDSRSTRFLSAIFLLPWAIPVLPGILSVRWMMSSQWGILNLISEDLGLGTHHWLASRWTAISALIIFHIWKYLPFWTVIILAARRGIPRQLYEAGAIDGANPFQTLIRVILPQAVPAITAVTIFHFFFTWNDYFTPLVYLVGKDSLYPISVGIGQFVSTFGQYPGRAMATAVMTLLLPAVMFFFAQRQFMQGIVLTGVEK